MKGFGKSDGDNPGHSLMEELYQDNSRIVYHFLLSLSHNANLAEDLMQETFLKAYQSLDRYDGSCKVSTWLCQIARHLYYQHLAGRKHEVLAGDGVQDAGDGKGSSGRGSMEDRAVSKSILKSSGQASPTEDAAIHRIELLQVLKQMQKLPEQMRQVIYLRAAADLSFREIGEVLGRSENWARVNFYRGKELLLKAKKEDEQNE